MATVNEQVVLTPTQQGVRSWFSNLADRLALGSGATGGVPLSLVRTAPTTTQAIRPATSQVMPTTTQPIRPVASQLARAANTVQSTSPIASQFARAANDVVSATPVDSTLPAAPVAPVAPTVTVSGTNTASPTMAYPRYTENISPMMLTPTYGVDALDSANAAMRSAQDYAAALSSGQVPVVSMANQYALDALKARFNAARSAAASSQEQLDYNGLLNDPALRQRAALIQMRDGLSTREAIRKAMDATALERGQYGLANKLYDANMPLFETGQAARVQAGLQAGVDVPVMRDALGYQVMPMGIGGISHSGDNVVAQTPGATIRSNDANALMGLGASYGGATAPYYQRNMDAAQQQINMRNAMTQGRYDAITNANKVATDAAKTQAQINQNRAKLALELLHPRDSGSTSNDPNQISKRQAAELWLRAANQVQDVNPELADQYRNEYNKVMGLVGE